MTPTYFARFQPKAEHHQLLVFIAREFRYSLPPRSNQCYIFLDSSKRLSRREIRGKSGEISSSGLVPRISGTDSGPSAIPDGCEISKDPRPALEILTSQNTNTERNRKGLSYVAGGEAMVQRGIRPAACISALRSGCELSIKHATLVIRSTHSFPWKLRG